MTENQSSTFDVDPDQWHDLAETEDDPIKLLNCIFEPSHWRRDFSVFHSERRSDGLWEAGVTCWLSIGHYDAQGHWRPHADHCGSGGGIGATAGEARKNAEIDAFEHALAMYGVGTVEQRISKAVDVANVAKLFNGDSIESPDIPEDFPYRDRVPADAATRTVSVNGHGRMTVWEVIQECNDLKLSFGKYTKKLGRDVSIWEIWNHDREGPSYVGGFLGKDTFAQNAKTDKIRTERETINAYARVLAQVMREYAEERQAS